MELSELVAAAKKRSGKALEELYKRTNQAAYYTALAITKNAEDASDIVQDTYINVFSTIDTIQDNSFLNYLKKAVANACKNNLKRRNAVLFSSDEEESSILDNIEEQSEDFLPDSYIEQSVKREQIMSIINGLSDVQRATILFFYFDEMSISEIAETMECSESTVKSRIAYAKKHIRDEVEKLEQQGDKLYGKAFIPVPFLKRLFAEDSKNHKLSESAAKTIFHNVITSPAVVGTTGMGGLAVSGLFAKFAGLTAAGKAAIAGAGAVIIVGGSVAGMAATGRLNNIPVKAASAAASSSETAAAAVSSQIASSIESSSLTVSSSQPVSSTVSVKVVSAVSTVSSKPAAQKTISSSHTVQKAASKAPTTKSTPQSHKSTSATKAPQSKTATQSGAVAGNDWSQNAEWLSTNLGFYNNSAGCYYNPDNNKAASAVITVGGNGSSTSFRFTKWGGNISSVSRNMFKFYLPNSYNKLYSMIDAWSNGSDAYTGKHFTMDGRDVVFYFYESSGRLNIEIGNK